MIFPDNKKKKKIESKSKEDKNEPIFGLRTVNLDRLFVILLFFSLFVRSSEDVSLSITKPSADSCEKYTWRLK